MGNNNIDRITISGPEDEIRAYIDACANENMILDPEKFMPMPSNLTSNAETVAWRFANWGTVHCGPAHEQNGEPSEIQRFGATRIAGKLVSRWSGPTKLLFEVSKRYPRLVIETDWYNEGGFYGSAMFVGGLLIHSHEEDEGEVMLTCELAESPAQP